MQNLSLRDTQLFECKASLYEDNILKFGLVGARQDYNLQIDSLFIYLLRLRFFKN